MPKAILQNTKYQGDIIWYEVSTFYGRISGKIGKVSKFYAAEDYCQDGVALFELSRILVGCSKLRKIRVAISNRIRSIFDRDVAQKNLGYMSVNGPHLRSQCP